MQNFKIDLHRIILISFVAISSVFLPALFISFLTRLPFYPQNLAGQLFAMLWFSGYQYMPYICVAISLIRLLRKDKKLAFYSSWITTQLITYALHSYLRQGDLSVSSYLMTTMILLIGTIFVKMFASFRSLSE